MLLTFTPSTQMCCGGLCLEFMMCYGSIHASTHAVLLRACTSDEEVCCAIFPLTHSYSVKVYV